MEFQDYLLKIREKNKLTQRQLAVKLGCSQSAVSAWEKGINSPNIDKVRRLWRLYPVSPEEFFGERDGGRRHSAGAKNSLITLEWLRKGRGLSRAQLAGLVGVSEKTVENWERRGIPNLGEIKLIVNYFQIDVNELRE